MTRIQRRIIFWLLVVFFILFTPLMLFYALGYSYDWPNHRLVKTGAFYLKSKPSGAKIYINNKYRGKTTHLIKRLKPKSYQIEVRFEDYHSWTKKLSIQSQQISEARNIVLFSKNPSIEKTAQSVVEIEEFLKTPVEISNEQKAKKIIENVPGALAWQLCGEDIFYLQRTDLILYQSDLMTGEMKEQVSLQPLPEQKKQVQSKNVNYQIACLNVDTIAVLDPQEKLFLFNPEQKVFEKIDQRIKGIRFSPDHKKLTYWTDNEIWVFWLEEVLVQPYRQPGDKILVTRFAQGLGDVVWYTKNNEYLIFTVGDKIKIAELDNRDFVNIIDFIEIKAPKIFYFDKEKALYFLSNNILYKTEI